MQWFGSERSLQFLTGRPVVNQEQCGRVVLLLEKPLAQGFSSPGLRYEGFSKRMMAVN
jgi:hypothetical protein